VVQHCAGAREVVAPEKIAGELGLEDRKNVVRLYVFREIARGVGILSNRKPAGWVCGRVAGDALDLATLASGLRRDNPKRDNVLKAISAIVGVTVLDVAVARQLSESRNERGAARLTKRTPPAVAAGRFPRIPTGAAT
jgi:hypothetical protein